MLLSVAVGGVVIKSVISYTEPDCSNNSNPEEIKVIQQRHLINSTNDRFIPISQLYFEHCCIHC